MKNLAMFLMIAIMVYAMSCTDADSQSSVRQSNVDSTLLAQQADTATTIFYKGVLVMGPESNYMRDCGTKKDWWIEDESGYGLEKEYFKMTTRPYQQVYIELKGTLRPAPADGFASEYDALLVVKEVIRLDDLDVDNNCAAAGTEEFN